MTWCSRSATGRVAPVGIACAVLVGLAGCGTAAVPVVDPTPPTVSDAPTDAGPSPHATDAHPSGDRDVADGARSPTLADAGRSDEVERAANGFVAASFTRGYPDDDAEAYLRRTRRLMTAQGFARYERLDARRGGPRAAAALDEQHLRTRAEIRSVRPRTEAGDRASVQVGLRLVTERDDGGSWETLTVGAPQEQVLDLVDEPGAGWLVDVSR